MILQAAQVRKDHYVPERGVAYDPEACHTCTIHAGTVVQQVNTFTLSTQPAFPCSEIAAHNLTNTQRKETAHPARICSGTNPCKPVLSACFQLARL